MKKLLIVLLLFTSSLYASIIGSISSFKGSVNLQRDTETLIGKINLPIHNKDIISTRDNSNVVIDFNDGTIITIGKNSSLDIAEYIYTSTNKEESKASLRILKGSFKSVTGFIGKVNPDKFKLSTKTASIGIRGTVIAGNQELVAVTYGSVNVTAQNKTVVVNADEYVSTAGAKVSEVNKLTDKIVKMLTNQLGTPVKANSKANSDSFKSLDTITKTVEKAVPAKKSTGGNESGGNESGGGHGHD